MSGLVIVEERVANVSSSQSLPKRLSATVAIAFSLLFSLASISSANAQIIVAPLDDMVLDPNALVMPTSGNFGRILNGSTVQQEALVTYEGYQFAAWYHNGSSDEDIFLSRRDLNGTTWETIDTGYGLENGDATASLESRRWDSHDVVTLGISGDGRIHLSYDQHVDEFRYLTTDTGFATSPSSVWNQANFELERNSLNPGGATIPRVTYPRFTNLGDNLAFTYRDRSSSNGDHYIANYDSQTGLWNSTQQFTDGQVGTYIDVDGNSSDRRNAYLNGVDVDPTGRMHISWTWRENTPNANHDINYAYSDDNGATWNNNAGANLGNIITLNSPGIEVVDLDIRQALINQQGQLVDSEGGVHVLMRHRRQEPGFEWQSGDPVFDTSDAAYHHYYRDPVSGTWDVNRLPVDKPVGSRPKIGIDPDGNLFGIYRSGNDLIIAGAEKTASGYYDWDTLYTEAANDYEGDPLLDPVRLTEEGILSVFLQERAPTSDPEIPTASPLHVLEFNINPETPVLPQGTLIAGWEQWASNGNKAATQTDGITTGTTSNNMGNDNGFGLFTDGSTDGTWGTLDTPTADATTDENADAYRLTNGEDGSIDFVLTDTGGVDRDLALFQFDTATFRPDAANSWELSVVSGDLTAGTIASGIAPNVTGGVYDWYDVDIDLTGLADHTLDANGTVTFRLEFTGGTLGATGHHQTLDNVAISELVSMPGDFDFDGDVDGADFLSWQRSDGTAVGLAAWQDNYGAPAALNASSASVPEPGAALLLAGGMILGLTRMYSRHRHEERPEDG